MKAVVSPRSLYSMGDKGSMGHGRTYLERTTLESIQESDGSCRKSWEQKFVVMPRCSVGDLEDFTSFHFRDNIDNKQDRFRNAEQAGDIG